MRVIVQLKETSQPIYHNTAASSYTKGKLFCVYMRDGTVVKYPIANIWRIVEDYGEHTVPS